MPGIPQQIRLVPGGLWHQRRQDNGRDETKCGIVFGKELVPATRDYKLDDKICPDCHTQHEVDTGEIDVLVKEDARYPEDLPISKRPSSEERRAMRRREKRVAEQDTEVDLPSSDTVLDEPPNDADE